MLQRLDDVRARYRQEALERGISPRDVDLLLSDLVGQPVTYVMSHGEAEIDPAPLQKLLARRFGGEPLQYIRRRTEFFSHDFYVDERVLIPRPETEVVVETVLSLLFDGALMIDIGTGSGCIAISVEKAQPQARVVGADISLDALAVADLNRRRLKSKVKLVASNLLDAIDAEFDVVVSNPPYIAAGDLNGLATEVRQYEPRLALTPGPRGTEVIERLLDESGRVLAGRGRVVMEIGYGQEESVRELAVAKRFQVESVVPDLAGINRVVVLSRHG